MGISTIRERQLTDALISIGHLLNEEKQVSVCKEGNEWVIAYNAGPSHKTQSKLDGAS